MSNKTVDVDVDEDDIRLGADDGDVVAPPPPPPPVQAMDSEVRTALWWSVYASAIGGLCASVGLSADAQSIVTKGAELADTALALHESRERAGADKKGETR